VCRAATPSLYADCGVDIIEFGVADGPAVLDGPTVSASMRRAAEAGVRGALAAETIRAASTGVDAARVWMTYPTNTPDLLDWVLTAEVDGFLTPSSTAAGTGMERGLRKRGICTIGFLSHAPTAAEVRRAAGCEGYVMVAADDGVTGPRQAVRDDNGPLLRALTRRGVSVPKLLGFGLTTGSHARRTVELGAGGVVVGSACIRAAQQGEGDLRRLLTEIRAGLDEGREQAVGDGEHV